MISCLIWARFKIFHMFKLLTIQTAEHHEVIPLYTMSVQQCNAESKIARVGLVLRFLRNRC